MIRYYRLVLSLIAIALLVQGAQTAWSATADYTFQQIARSGRMFDPFGFDAPVVNNNGAVGYKATRVNGTSAIFRNQGHAPTLIAGEHRFNRFGSITINFSGQVGFEGSPRNVNGEGIFRGSGGAVQTIAGTRDLGDFDFVNAGPSMNVSGQVAFIGERIVGSDFIDGVYVGNGGPVVPIYDETGQFDDFIGNPSLNDQGQAAFLATLDTGVGGLFLGNGGAVTTVADESGPFGSVFGFSDPSLNEQGQVAFRAGTDQNPDQPSGGSTGEGIFLYDNGTVITIFHGNVGDFASLGNPSLNNQGQVAFIIEPTFGQQILVTGPDFVADRVIGTGDVLLGRTVSGVLFSREGLNDVGQLAFTAFFEDGSAGVFLATPVQ